MQIHAKQIVTLIQQLPQREEVKFLEKQPSIKKKIQETSSMFVDLIWELKSLFNNDSQNRTSTIPFNYIEETIDQLLDNAAIQYTRKNQQSITTVQRQETTNILRPPIKYGFQDSIQLNKLPFIPVLKEKPFAQTEIDGRILEAQSNPFDFFKQNELIEFSHPYEEEILRLPIQDFVLNTPTQLRKYNNLESPFLIENEDKLASLVMKIQNEVDQQGFSEIAVDLEHHHDYSYLGLTCLIQISTRSNDYIIDPFPIWKQVGNILNVIFTNPKVIKVFHGSESDVLWLQRDFGIYIVNLFDTFHASKELLMPQNSFAFLLSHYCKKSTDKKYQLADWTQRPIIDEMIQYAQIDTHYLLDIYDRMRIELKQNGIEAVIKRSKETALKIYKKPLQDQDQSLSIILSKNNRAISNYELTVKLLEVREELGLQYDQNPRQFLPNGALFKIVDELPTSIAQLKSLLGGDKYIRPIVKENMWRFLKVLLEYNKELKSVEIKQQQEIQIQKENEIPQQIQIEIEPLKIVNIPVTIQKYQNQQQITIFNQYEQIDNQNLTINSQFNCENPFQLINIFHQDLGTQIYNSMKQQSLSQHKEQIQLNQEQKIKQVNTSEYIELPKIEQPVKEKITDIRLNNTLQNKYGTKILKRHQQIELQKAQKQNIGNRFKL